MQATTSDNWIEAALQHGEGQVGEQSADAPLGRLADSLLARGVEHVSLQPEGARRAETLSVSVDGQSVLVWESGVSFLTGWHPIGPVSDPEGAADRIASLLVGDGR